MRNEKEKSLNSALRARRAMSVLMAAGVVGTGMLVPVSSAMAAPTGPGVDYVWKAIGYDNHPTSYTEHIPTPSIANVRHVTATQSYVLVSRDASCYEYFSRVDLRQELIAGRVRAVTDNSGDPARYGGCSALYGSNAKDGEDAAFEWRYWRHFKGPTARIEKDGCEVPNPPDGCRYPDNRTRTQNDLWYFWTQPTKTVKEPDPGKFCVNNREESLLTGLPVCTVSPLRNAPTKIIDVLPEPENVIRKAAVLEWTQKIESFDTVTDAPLPGATKPQEAHLVADRTGARVEVEMTGLESQPTVNRPQQYNGDKNTGRQLLEGHFTKPGVYNVTATAREPQSETPPITHQFTIRVADATAPVVNDIEDQTVKTSHPVDIALPFTDNSGQTDGGKIVGQLPKGLSYVPGNEGGKIVGTPAPEEAGKEFEVTLQVTDTPVPGAPAHDPNTTSKTFKIIVLDGTKPEIDFTPGPLLTARGEALENPTDNSDKPSVGNNIRGGSFGVGVTDNYDKNPVTTVDGLPSYMVYDKTAGVIKTTGDIPAEEAGKTYPITVTSTDAAGNKQVATGDLLIQDGTEPVVVVHDMITTTIANMDERIEASDNDGGKPTIEVKTELPKGIVSPDGYSYTGVADPITAIKPDNVHPVTVVATDKAGNKTNDKNFTITVINRTPPVPIEEGTEPDPANPPVPGDVETPSNGGGFKIPNKTVYNTDEIDFDTPIKSISGHTCEAPSLPDGLKLDPETCKFTGQVPAPGDYPIGIIITDKDGNQSTGDFVLHVKDITAPVIIAEDQIFPTDTENHYPIKVTEESTITPTVNVIFENNVDPISGERNVTARVDDKGNVTFDVTATSHTPTIVPAHIEAVDSVGNTSTKDILIKFKDATPPVMSHDKIEETFPTDSPIDPIVVTWTDNSGVTDGGVLEGDLPEGLEAVKEDGKLTISGTPSPKAAGKTFTLKYTVCDTNIEGQVEHEPNCSVTDIILHIVDKTPPVLNIPDSVVGLTDRLEPLPDPKGDTPSVENNLREVVIPVEVTDNADPKPTVAIDGVDGLLTYDDARKAFVGTFAPEQVNKVYEATVIAIDEAGNKTTKPLKVTIVDGTEPKIHAEDQTIYTGQAFTYTFPVVTDNLDEKPVVKAEGLPEGLTFNAETYTIEGTPAPELAAGETFEFPVKIDALDEAGNVMLTKTIVLKLRDIIPPVFTGEGAKPNGEPTKINPDDPDSPYQMDYNLPDKVYNVDEGYEIDLLPKDNSGKYTCKAEGLPEGAKLDEATCKIIGNTPIPGEYPIVVTLTDPSGNVTKGNFKFTILDNVKPEIGGEDQTYLVNTDNEYEIPVTDNDKKNPLDIKVVPSDPNLVKVEIVDGKIKLKSNSPKVTKVPVQITVTDKAGNVATKTITVSFTDDAKAVTPAQKKPAAKQAVNYETGVESNAGLFAAGTLAALAAGAAGLLGLRRKMRKSE